MAVFQPDAGDTVYTIKIKMNLSNGLADELHHTFEVDKTAPQISTIKNIEMWDGMLQARLISFETDDICTTSLYIRPAKSNENFIPVVSSYETVSHRFKIGRNQFDGDFEFYIQAKNRSGLISIDDKNGALYSFSLKRNFNLSQFSRVPWSIPAGYMLNKVTDFDHDGHKEIVISRYDENSGFGPVEIYEFNNEDNFYSNSQGCR